MKLRFRKLGPERAVGFYLGKFDVEWTDTEPEWTLALHLWWWTAELEWGNLP